MNSKGFTLIELVLGFILVTIIVIPIFSVVLNYKEKQSKEATKAELTSYKNLLTYDIQEDLTIKGYTFAAVDENTLTITLSDESEKVLTVNKQDQKITYGDTNYPLNGFGEILEPTNLVENGSYFKIRNNSISIAIPIKNIAKLGKKYDYGIYIYAEKTS